MNLLPIILLSLSFSQLFCQKTNADSQFFTDSIFSHYLNEYRKHNVYLPKDFVQHQAYKMIYATDGNEISDTHPVKLILDSLINHKIIEPIIYVESFSNQKIVDSITFSETDKEFIKLRNLEYVESFSNHSPNPEYRNRFKNHLNYFSEELISSIENKLKIKVTKEKRFFYGSSNGAGFGINLLNQKPEIFETYICLSPAGSAVQNLSWNKKINYPKVIVRYGNDEDEYFLKEAEMVNKSLSSIIKDFDFGMEKGNHDEESWINQFTEIISKELKL